MTLLTRCINNGLASLDRNGPNPKPYASQSSSEASSAVIVSASRIPHVQLLLRHSLSIAVCRKQAAVLVRPKQCRPTRFLSAQYRQRGPTKSGCMLARLWTHLCRPHTLCCRAECCCPVAVAKRRFAPAQRSTPAQISGGPSAAF